MILTASSLKRLSKYEMEFDKNLNDVETTGTYTMKTDDLKEALQNMLDDPDFERVLNGWYTPVSCFMDRGAILTEEGFPKGRFAGLKEILEGKDKAALEGMLVRLENGDAEPETEEEVPAAEEPIVKETPAEETAAAPEETETAEEAVKEELAEETPACEKASPVFSEKEKWDRIVRYASNPDGQPEEEAGLVRNFLEEFVDHGDIVALRYKAFSCLQGGGLYAKDLSLAKECFASLFEKTQKPQYAGILGSLYKNDAEAPDYQKAFYYYLQGAAGGDDDSCAALGDMFMEGKFADQNPAIAERIYTHLYHTISDRVEEGKTSMTFVQTAMKIGGLKLMAKEPAQALPYYEKAREAYLKLADSEAFTADPAFLEKLDQFIAAAQKLANQSDQ